ncbi:MAG TPA: SPOR domain-containing protein [Candidatus Avimonas sp.]|nr:SPOR domain-containing protein [Candidatus Avimonas sp.]HQA16381.1 SPOR domain-containing protein [Candidatus Avimonas sp.]HQD37462.1 SPOR domain-containing protein [Candidatus Avimonas sp.]
MDTFRADVGAALGASAAKTEKKKSNQEIANEVIKGLWGNGAERRRRLAEAGYDYNEVQGIVNQKLAGTYKPPAEQPKAEPKATEKPAETQKSENLYRVQVGAFENKTYAERLAEQLKKAGYPAYVVKV